MSSNAIAGALLGTAVGDAIGLPYEALSRRRARRLFGPPDRHRLLFGRGMVSDDTDHTCLVAQAVCRSGGNVAQFRADLARGLRWWLLGLPAGIGFATLRAILKLWIGFPPLRSGVYSAGNGPAMRVAVLGAAISDTKQLADYVEAATTITHTDPRAYVGALAVALAARQSARHEVDGKQLIEELSALSPGAAATECCALLAKVVDSVGRNDTTVEFAAQLGCEKGVSGFVFHSVPVAIHAWLSFPNDLAKAVEAAVLCGGDTDTVGAIVGGMVGAGTGAEGIPGSWADGLVEWPRSVSWMRSLAASTACALETGMPEAPPRYFLPGILARNALFLVVVLSHVFRRALPPY